MVFENYSERGRHTITLAQAEARDLQHHYVGTEHLLIGILAEGRGVAARVLGAYRMTVADARRYVSELVGSGGDPVAGQVPFTPRARNVLLRANRVRLGLGADAVEPEHLLLAVIRDDGGVAARLLSQFGVDPERVRADLIHASSDPSADN